MKINYVLFNPCGNITALVDSAVDKNQRIDVANKIMELEPTCEQVGFVQENADFVMLEMAGGEFCGNAARCAALFKNKTKVLCSGYAQFIEAIIDSDVVKINLPSAPTGIDHKIFFESPSKAFEEEIKKETKPTGYMFIEGDKLTPLVYIPTSNTLFWEKSCASGTMIAALTLAKKEGKDIEKCFIEPGGELHVSAKVNGAVSLWGSISKIKEASFQF